MRRTPRLPKFIRKFSPANCPYKHPWCLGAKNVYELIGLEKERKLFGTERMVFSDGTESNGWAFGDWDCDMLLLMQDAAAVDGIAERIGKHPDPFSARNFIEEPRGKGATTNRNLYNLASTIDCRKLVGSALIGILKPGSDYTSRIANCPYVRNHCLHVLAWVLNPKQTPNLKSLACLGQEASQSLSELQASELVDCNRFRMTELWHPRYWPSGGKAQVTAAWGKMAAASGFRVH